jgi:hypothetical protein
MSTQSAGLHRSENNTKTAHKYRFKNLPDHNSELPQSTPPLQKLPFHVTWHQLSIFSPELHPKHNSMCSYTKEHCIKQAFEGFPHIINVNS